MTNELTSVINNIVLLMNIKKAISNITKEIIPSDSQIIQEFISLNQFMEDNLSENDSFREFYEKIGTVITASEKTKLGIDKFQFGEWLRVYFSNIATLLINVMNDSRDISSDCIKVLDEFLNYQEIPNDTRAAAFLLFADVVKNIEPKLSYEYGIKAFELNPDVLKLCGLEKTMDISTVENKYYESCPICGSSVVSPFKNISQFAVINGQKCFLPFKLWMKCSDCTNLFAYNFPVSEMGNINGHYTRNSQKSFIQPNRPLYIYSDIFNSCNQFTKGKKYLEIGVGNGEMLATALEFGYDVSAIEICKEDCENISAILDVDIKWTDFLEADIEGKFDIIVMGDVLEHVSRPYDAILKARDLLSDDGVLWISTPNYESGFTRLMKDNDPMWNQLNHFTYFSYNGLVKILDRIGLKVVHYDVSNRYNGSMELYIKKVD